MLKEPFWEVSIPFTPDQLCTLKHIFSNECKLPNKNSHFDDARESASVSLMHFYSSFKPTQFLLLEMCCGSGDNYVVSTTAKYISLLNFHNSATKAFDYLSLLYILSDNVIEAGILYEILMTIMIESCTYTVCPKAFGVAVTLHFFPSCLYCGPL